MKPYGVGTHSNCVNETIQMSTCNIEFRAE